MASRGAEFSDGVTRDGSSAEVPHPLGVRDLKRERRELAERLYREGVSGPERRVQLTALVHDRLAAHFASVAGGAPGVTLAAVGSLGRGDAGPASDLDLVLLHDGESLPKATIAKLAQELWYPIWDAGLELDYSTRSVTETRQVASKDLAAAAGQLDLHAIAGDEALAKATRALIYQDWRAAARKRLPDLLSASRARAERFGEVAYLIEPNLKESRGGTRDYISLAALAATWLTDRPHGAVDSAAQTLMDVRDAIQMVSGRPQNVLGRHLADDVAQLLGYDDPDDVLSALADAGRTVAFALDSTERRARVSLERSGVGSRAFIARRRAAAPRHISVGEGLIDVDGDLALAPGFDPSTDGELPLRAAAVAATTGLPFTPGLLEAMPECPDMPEPWTPEARGHLRDLLRASNNLVTVWEAVDLEGQVVRWIPEWRGVRNRPQRSPVHRFTVDRHMLQTVVLAGKHPRSVANLDLVLMTGLLHDIGKRPGAEDHSIDGAALIPAIGARIGLSEGMTADITLLVREHLTLARLATTEDIADPATADALLEAVDGRADLLEALRSLTEADALAAGPKAWTAWRAALIESLTEAARRRLGA
jgi:[protein-PII] uridylyltransferase